MVKRTNRKNRKDNKRTNRKDRKDNKRTNRKNRKDNKRTNRKNRTNRTNRKNRTRNRSKNKKRIQQDGGDLNLIVDLLFRKEKLSFLPNSTILKDYKKYLKMISLQELQELLDKKPEYKQSPTIQKMFNYTSDGFKEGEDIKFDWNTVNCKQLLSEDHDTLVQELLLYILDCNVFEDMEEDSYVVDDVLKDKNWFNICLGMDSLDDTFEGFFIKALSLIDINLNVKNIVEKIKTIIQNQEIKKLLFDILRNRLKDCTHKPRTLIDKIFGTVSFDSYKTCDKKKKDTVLYLYDDYHAFLIKEIEGLSKLEKTAILIFCEERQHVLSKYVSLEVVRRRKQDTSNVMSLVKQIYKQDLPEIKEKMKEKEEKEENTGELEGIDLEQEKEINEEESSGFFDDLFESDKEKDNLDQQEEQQQQQNIELESEYKEPLPDSSSYESSELSDPLTPEKDEKENLDSLITSEPEQQQKQYGGAEDPINPETGNFNFEKPLTELNEKDEEIIDLASSDAVVSDGSGLQPEPIPETSLEPEPIPKTSLEPDISSSDLLSSTVDTSTDIDKDIDKKPLFEEPTISSSLDTSLPLQSNDESESFSVSSIDSDPVVSDPVVPDPVVPDSVVPESIVASDIEKSTSLVEQLEHDNADLIISNILEKCSSLKEQIGKKNYLTKEHLTNMDGCDKKNISFF